MAVVVAGRDGAASVDELQRAHARPGPPLGHDLSGVRVAYLDAPAAVTAREEITGVVEREVLDRARRRPGLERRLAGGQVSQLHTPVLVAGGERLAIGAECN